MCAATHGGDALTRMLLEHGGSEVNAADDDGRTACHRACNRGHSGLLRQLLEAGADPTLHDVHGITAGDLAAAGHQQECVTILEEWHCGYTLNRTRSFVLAGSTPPVNGASTYLLERATSGLPMPTVHVSTHQQHAYVGGEGHVEVGPVAVGSLVAVHAIEELNGEVFVELMELMGIIGCGAHEL